MMKQSSSIRYGLAGAASAFSMVMASTPMLSAQSTTTTATATVAPAFTAEVGRASAKPNPRLTVNYAVLATQPLSSRAVSQKMRLSFEEDGLREVQVSPDRTEMREGTTTRYLTINTGKYKNLGQLEGTVAGIFRRFLAGAAANAELGKIGDAKYGGEIRFVAVSSDLLRCDSIPDISGEGGFRLKRRDVEALLSILQGPPSAAN